MRRAAAIIGVALALAVGASACSRDDKGLGDAPIGRKHEAPREIIVMPDQFQNIAIACDGHGHRIYATTREAAPVVIDDPTCPGGAG